ncbi:alpha-L-arabinofuranosidase C-terminal domain-containing protein [Hymenobacter sp. BT770]|uniref:alpha-L-arabinofuranosidase C-terminal domain-containing protein n=1 Tax=Hymenobacter sp. BT770 TaxID=2886942 RepID=UPI001D1141DD|nr:alpha-L-arabinofuranosidase C-terminal domain-containing protein [Hymenobacter sp. BT770]MCC3154406.1 carbohydrate binding domain-containing protein [Hymenobacter sp. BT770]MDO3416277.1 alpha-L-arabinofuranosidase C-terminal domain-containing protein [Hymenobacter sp. BT770]
MTFSNSRFLLSAAGLALAGLLPGHAARAQGAAPATLTVQVNKPGAAVSKNMYGLFFEDINFAADGGLYPELVKNKSFETDDHLIGWKAIRGAAGLESYIISSDKPISNSNNHFLRMSARTAGPDAGFVNEGFRGMGVKQGAEYTFSIYARKGPGSVSGLNVTLEETRRPGAGPETPPSGQALAQAQITGLTNEWKKYTVVMKPSATAAHARLKLTLEGAGTVDLDVVSLFPKDTWMKRENGLRPDLVQLLKDMKPGFLRFPGGCIVEGITLDNRYQWKETIGDVASRKPMINRWNKEFKHRYTPDYYQSFGLGFFEYFQLSEDIGAEPLPILNVGMACQFNSAELAPITSSAAKGPNAAGQGDEPTLDTFIQDAIDLIEFANGPASSTWGAKRVAMGHPAPFNLKMIGIGNEQWGPQYLERYEPFAKAVKAKYPNMQIVSSAGPAPEGELFDKATLKLRELKAEFIDEHYYAKPDWFRQNVGRYDNYPRTGPKIFAGEYAAQSVGIASENNKNNWDCAISEAAFMTGLERNADVVAMASYAPMLAHVDAWQWTPNMIWFDNLTSYGTVNYYVQKLYSLNKGTSVLPVQLPGNAKNGTDNLFASAVADAPTGDVIVKLVNYSTTPRAVKVNLAGAKKVGKAGTAFVMASDDLNTQNTIQEPKKLTPKEEKFSVSGSTVSYTLAPNSFTVLRIPGKK